MPQMTTQTRMVLAEFLEDPDAELYGREVLLATGLKPGTLYPILKRLEAEGLLNGRWETPPTGRAGRVRCYYRLTSEGWAVARQEAAPQRSHT